MIVKWWSMYRRRAGTSMFVTFALLALLLLAGAVIVFNGRWGEESRQHEAMNHELRMTLTRQIAGRIDNDLRRLAAIPQTLAGALSARADWERDQLQRLMMDMLKMDARLYGACAAFEPGEFGNKNDFAFYVCRTSDGLEPSELIMQYRQLAWYTEPRNQRQGVWSEPFTDHGTDKNYMVAYSVPIWRSAGAVPKTSFAGVATADLSTAYFEDMRRWLDELKLGKNGYGFVLSATGTFVSHPRDEYRMPRKITDIPEFQEGKALRNLTRRLLNHETGSAAAVDPHTGRRSIFYFTPIPSAQWMFVAVIEE